MEEGTVANWLKKVGDSVHEGDILAEIETDKATMEFESFYEGTLLHIGVAEGETAYVDALLAIIGDSGEDITGLINGEAAETTNEVPQDAAPAPNQDDSSVQDSTSSASDAEDLPQGVQIITMPRLSDTMEEGTVATWLKKEGDTIQEGDILAEIETDKATMEFESFYSGTLLKIGIPEGGTALVDALLAIIGPAGTDVSGVTAAPSKDATAVEPSPVPVLDAPAPVKRAPAAPAPVVAAPVVADQTRRFISPLAKKLAQEKGVDMSHVSEAVNMDVSLSVI